MRNPQTSPPIGGGAAPRLVIRVQRRARLPAPWAWVIYEEGQSEPCRCSTRFYRSAEDAWMVGGAMLNRLPHSAITSLAEAHRSAVSGRDPTSD